MRSRLIAACAAVAALASAGPARADASADLPGFGCRTPAWAAARLAVDEWCRHPRRTPDIAEVRDEYQAEAKARSCRTMRARLAACNAATVRWNEVTRGYEVRTADDRWDGDWIFLVVRDGRRLAVRAVAWQYLGCH